MPELNDIPRELRLLATQIEMGSIQADAVAIAIDCQTDVSVYGIGGMAEDPDYMRQLFACGIEALDIAFHGE